MLKVNDVELKELFKELKQNNEIGFERLYSNYNRLVYKIAFSILKNKEDSEDIVQIVFSKIYKMDRQKLPNDKEASWLYTVTKNEVISLLRKKNNYIDIEDKDSEINNIIDQIEFNRLIDRLSNKEKEIVSLKILTNLSFTEIGKLVNEPTGTVKWRYYKSVHTLKILLSNLGMFVITFVIGVKAMFSDRVQKQEQIKEDSVIEETTKEENEKEEIKSDSTESNFKDILQNKTDKEEIKEETIINTENNNIDFYQIGILSISGVFLLFTIIFTIFFAKYQLKRKKKASK